MDDSEDRVIATLPVRFSDALASNIQILQYPLLTRPLQIPPSAAASGKLIRARVKPQAKRLEIHVPVDTRTDVWNQDKGKELGQARLDDDREKNQEPISKGKMHEAEQPRLAEVRMRSEQIGHRGSYVLGVVRDGQLHLHPIAETHQLRPTLTYLDALNKKNRRRGAGDDSDSDDGPPPDPDEPPPPPVEKKERKASADAKEVHVAARKAADDKNGMNPMTGGLTQVRRDILMAIRSEEDERWEDLQFFDGDTTEGGEAFEAIFSKNDAVLDVKSELSTFLKDIRGL